MVNEHGQIECDITHIILEDGKCLYPNYIEVKDGKGIKHFSDDPNNVFKFPASDIAMQTDPKWNDWVREGMLKNRIEFRRSEAIDLPEGVPDGHYVDIDTLILGMKLKKDMNEVAEAEREKTEEEVQAKAEELKAQEEANKPAEEVTESPVPDTPAEPSVSETPESEPKTEEQLTPEPTQEESPTIQSEPETTPEPEVTQAEEPITLDVEQIKKKQTIERVLGKTLSPEEFMALLDKESESQS